MIRLMDEALAAGGLGVLLFMQGDDTPPAEGMYLRDAQGQLHRVTKVDRQEDIVTLFVEGGDCSYFERLFRSVRLDATAFEVVAQEAIQ